MVQYAPNFLHCGAPCSRENLHSLDAFLEYGLYNYVEFSDVLFFHLEQCVNW